MDVQSECVLWQAKLIFFVKAIKVSSSLSIQLRVQNYGGKSLLAMSSKDFDNIAQQFGIVTGLLSFFVRNIQRQITEQETMINTQRAHPEDQMLTEIKVNELNSEEGCMWLENGMSLCLQLAEAAQTRAKAVPVGAATKKGVRIKKAKLRAKPEKSLARLTQSCCWKALF